MFVNFWPDAVDIRIAAIEGTTSIASGKMQMRRHLLNKNEKYRRAWAQRLGARYFTQMSIFSDAGNYEKP
jgi:hypothetical protein